MRPNHTEQIKGQQFILIEVFLWSLFPVITILSYQSIKPLFSLAYSTLFSAIFFALYLTKKGSWHTLRNTAALRDILMGTFIIGIGFYTLYFLGLTYTTAGNASIISQAEVLFSYLFFHIIRKEDIPKSHILGALLITFGAVIILLPNAHTFNIGDMLVLSAVFIAPFGNYFQRRARIQVSSEVIMFLRSSITTLFLFPFLYVTQGTITFSYSVTSITLLILNGIFLLGLSKILWLEGIHRISVTKANALNSLAPFLTLLFAWALLHETPQLVQVAAFIPMFFGILLLNKTHAPE